MTKLVFLLLLGTFMRSMAAEGQGITLIEKNAPLQKVFKKLHKTAGLNFLYNADMLRDAKPVNVKIVNAGVEEALSQIFNGQPLQFELRRNTIIVQRKTPASPAPQVQQQKTSPSYPVSGTVKDNMQLALPGVSIRILSSGKGMVTGRDGRYTIEVMATDTLEFSFIGYKKQQVAVRNKVDIDVVMEPVSGSLEEVVVSGFGTTQKKVSVTGAISTVQTKELKQSPVANLSNALAGRLPGLTTIQSSGIPGADAANVFIRGIGTYGDARSPLVVIDGLPRGDANFGEIDVNEIASISILKDAATTSLYGIQGANGVILVTTKRGSNRKTNIQFNAQYGSQQPVRLPERFNGLQQALLDNEGAKNDGIAPIWTDLEIQKYRDKSDPYTYPSVNWMDVILAKSTPQQQYNVNINGGNEKVKYFTSLGYLNQGTLLKYEKNNKYGIKQKYSRINFRSNIDIAATKMMDIRLDLASRLEERNGPGFEYNTVFQQASLLLSNSTPVFNPNGTYAAGRMIAADSRNPLGLIRNSGYYNNFWNSTNGTLQVTHRLDFITQGLSAKALFTFENYGAINVTQRQKFEAFRYRKDPITGVETYTPFSLETSLENVSRTTAERYYYYNAQLQYDRSFNKHNVSGLALFNRNFRSVGLGVLPFVYEGFVGRAAYNYDTRYFLEFNMGYNGSENFPRGKRYGFFPAVSAGWVVSAEQWYGLKAMNYLKLRGSYGVAGNDRIGGSRFLFITDYLRSGGVNMGESPQFQTGFNQNRIGNPIVTWERSYESNIGLETGFFNSQLKFEVDVFRKLRKNILTTPKTVPDFLGISTLAPVNIGQVLNRGFEAALNFNTHINKISVFGFVNWTYNRNKILEMDEPNLAYPYQKLTGHPVGYSLGYTAIGLFQSQEEIDKAPRQNFARVIPGDIRYKDMNNDGIINDADRSAIQVNNFPNNIVGASVGLAWKGIDCSVLFQASIGGKTNFPIFGPRLLDKRWTPQTAATATYPVVHKVNPANTNQLSTFFIHSSDYLKLKNLEIGYTLPNHLLKRIKLSSLRIFANGINLATWDKLPTKDFDPEQSTTGALLYPLMRVYNTGLALNF